MLLSESALAKDRDTPEEDAACADYFRQMAADDKTKATAGQRTNGPTTGGHHCSVMRNKTMPTADPRHALVTIRLIFWAKPSPAKATGTSEPKATPIKKAGKNRIRLLDNAMCTVDSESSHPHNQNDPCKPREWRNWQTRWT